MRILVVNCNTNAAMTARIAAIAQTAAASTTSIVPVTPGFGPESAEGYYESFVAAAAMLDAVERVEEPFDAIVLAGFGEHGREGMRQRWSVPVVDITEASTALAGLVSHRYGIVTTLDTAVPVIWDSIGHSGAGSRCVAVRAAQIPVSAIHGAVDDVADALEGQARTLIASGAEAIVLGCAGFAGLDQVLSSRLGVPVIDGVDAAVRLAETLVRAGLSNSRIGAYRPVNAGKRWVGWPIEGFAPAAVDQEAP